jgi:hypothetical protein
VGLRRFCIILGLLGAAWMAFVIYRGSLRLAIATNYPGMVTANLLVRYRGIAPSVQDIWLFNALLVLSSALLWIAVGLVLRAIIQSRKSRPRPVGG